MCRLSICIATLNRANVIGNTLDIILSQLPLDAEVVVVDGASTDNTQKLMEEYSARHPAIRYFREATNSGVDRDFDKAVGYARGEHCWLICDDDILAPHAIERALAALEDGRVDLLVVNAEIRDANLDTVLQLSLIHI